MATFAGSLDANVLLRLLLNDIPAQHEAVLKLLDSTANQLAVADTALIEVAFVLECYYEFTRSQIAEALDGIASLAELSCNRTLIAAALPLFVKYPSLSFEDCCLASYAELTDAKPLWTFDQKLARQAPAAKLLVR